MAVKFGFADQMGTIEDAKRVVGELAGVGRDPEIFEPKRKRRGEFDLLDLVTEGKKDIGLGAVADKYLRTQLIGKPLYLLPGVFAQ